MSESVSDIWESTLSFSASRLPLLSLSREIRFLYLSLQILIMDWWSIYSSNQHFFFGLFNLSIVSRDKGQWSAKKDPGTITFISSLNPSNDTWRFELFILSFLDEGVKPLVEEDVWLVFNLMFNGQKKFLWSNEANRVIRKLFENSSISPSCFSSFKI